MQTKNRESIHIVPEPKRHELIQTTYGIIGAMIEVYKNLGAGMPEYIYQEALLTELQANGFTAHKELEYHPIYKGNPPQRLPQNGSRGGDAYWQRDSGMQGFVGSHRTGALSNLRLHAWNGMACGDTGQFWCQSPCPDRTFL